MKDQYAKLVTRYDALQLRERWLVAVAVLSGIVLLGYTLVVEPALKRSQLAQRSIVEQRAQLAMMREQSVALQSPERDPDVAARAELASLKKQLDEIGGRLIAVESSLVPPQRMAGLLEDMIGRRSSLRLLSLKTFAVTPLLEKKTGVEQAVTERSVDNPASSSAGLFKHGIEIKLEGSYQELAAYLDRLERSKLKLIWSSVSLSANRHPKLVLTLTVYTLSLDRAWLIV